MSRCALVFVCLTLGACFDPGGDRGDPGELGPASSGGSEGSEGSEGSASSFGSTTGSTPMSSGSTLGPQTTSSASETGVPTATDPDTTTAETTTDPDPTGSTETCDMDLSVCGSGETCVEDACVVVPDGMVPVPQGVFQMGCDEAMQADCDNDELPSHAVTLASFAIDQTETSQGEYQACVDAGDCAPAGGDDAYGAPCNQQAEGPGLPVVCVSWFQAQDYCEFRGGRLPTEAEWEKAARGVEGNVFPWGDEPPSCNLAHYNDCNGGNLEPSDSNPEGGSPYGALNMSGNVFEWVADWYGPSYYATSPSTDPTGPATGDRRVIRSQGSNYNSNTMRASFRGPDFEAPAAEFGSPVVGIRCAADI